MIVERIYDQLGLDPLVLFALRSRNSSERPLQGGDRHWGATTFMLVQATICLLTKRDVLVVGRTAKQAGSLAKLILRYAERLDSQITSLTSLRIRQQQVFQRTAQRRMSNGATLTWLSQPRYEEGAARGLPSGLPFIDEDSNNRLDSWLQERLGPFSKIAGIRAERAYGEQEPRYNAYNRQGDFVLELTKSGAEVFVETYAVPITTVPITTVAIGT